MTSNPDKFHLDCTAGETISVSGSDNGTGSTVAFKIGGGAQGNGLPPSPLVFDTRLQLSIAVAFFEDDGGSFTLTLDSSNGDQKEYTVTQVAGGQNGFVITFKRI